MIPFISSKQLDDLKKIKEEHKEVYFIKTKLVSKQDLEVIYESEVLPIKKLWSLSNFTEEFLPKYYGSYLEEDLSSNGCYLKLHHIFFCLERLFKMSYSNLYQYKYNFVERVDFHDKIVRFLAFLQTMEISLVFLSPYTLFRSGRSGFYDFGSSKTFLKKLISKEEKSRKKEEEFSYLAPEVEKFLTTSNLDLDPFKTNTYSLALMILQLDLKQPPQKDEIQKLLKEFHKKHCSLTKNKQQVNEFLSNLTECLASDPQDRPDFIDLFCKREKVVKTDNIQKLIISK